MGPPQTRRSRKRGCPSERISEDVHQDSEEVTREKSTSLQCPLPLPQKCELKSLQLLETPDQHTKEYDREQGQEKPEVTPHGHKMQLVCINDCGHTTKKLEMNDKEKIPSQCESYTNQSADGSDGKEATAVDEQLCTVDHTDHKMGTNQEMDDLKQITKEPVPAKKKRRMGMCRLTERERRSHLILKSANRAENAEKPIYENSADVTAEEEKTSSLDVLSCHQHSTETNVTQKSDKNTQSKDDREESEVEATLSAVGDPGCADREAFEDDKKRNPDTEPIPKPDPQAEDDKQPSRAEPRCQMTLSEAVIVHESDLYVCENKDIKDPDQASELHCHGEEEEQLYRAENEAQVTVSEIVCEPERHKEPDAEQPPKPHPEVQQQPSRTDTEVQVTVSEEVATLCETHSHAEQQLSRTEPEVHVTNDPSDGSKVEIPGPLDCKETTKLLSDTDQREQLINQDTQRLVQVTHEKQTKNVENTFVYGTHRLSDLYNETNQNEATANDPATPVLTTVEKKVPVTDDGKSIIQNSSSDSEQMCNRLVTPTGSGMNGSCVPNDIHRSGPSSVSTVPPQFRESSDQSGLGGLDYVSDSQLNTIIMTDAVMARENSVSPDGYKDGTELIRGLIRELSSLNRTVMVTHRELESLRRKSKNSRNANR